jgi:hypothetical protein
MHTTLSSKVLGFAAAAPLVLALAGCSSDNNNSKSDGGTTSASATTSGTTSGSASTTTTSSAVGDAGPTDSGTPDSSTGPLSFGANVYAQVIQQCTGCHGVLMDGGPGLGIQGGHLDMGDAAAAFENLVGADGGGVIAQGGPCGPLGIDAGLKRVAPGDPDHSLLWNKLASNDGGGGSLLLSDGGPMVFCGNPMPLHLMALPTAEITTVHDWIEGGAKP